VENDYTGNKLLITRVDSGGQERWQPPTVICGFLYAKDHPFIINGPNQGYIVVWEDARNGNIDLYAQYIDSTGQVGIGEPAEKGSIVNEGLLLIEPNPFSQPIKIKYGIASPDWVELTVFDVTGRKVKELVKGTVETGVHTAMWDGKDCSDREVSSGIYFCRLQIFREEGKVISVKKIIHIGKEEQ
jgi:hypothetical protein